MTNTTAPQATPATTVDKADRIVYCRMSTTDVDEGQRFAAEESRTRASFIRAMYRRGGADYKAKRAALAGAL